MARNVLITGAGPAGLVAAEAAASLGAQVTLCGAEEYAPYWRPRLTRFLSEPAGAEKLAMRRPEWYAQRGIVLQTGKMAERVDAAARRVHWLGSGEASDFDALVVATGAAPNAPALPGAEGSQTLRSYDDAMRIRASALAAGRAVVVGGGLLGLETAWELSAAGVKCSILERGQWLLPRQLNRAGGLFLQKRLESSGIKFIVGQDPSGFSGLYRGACVVLAAGVHADLALIMGSGIASGRGITVDDHMRTSAAGVYACGDVAEYDGKCWGLLSVAQEQGRVAGVNAAGGEAVYVESPPSPMLKVGTVSVFSVGDTAEARDIRLLEEETENGYACLMVREDALAGAVLVGNTAAGMKVRKAVGEKKMLAGIQNVKDALNSL